METAAPDVVVGPTRRTPMRAMKLLRGKHPIDL